MLAYYAALGHLAIVLGGSAIIILVAGGVIRLIDDLRRGR